MADIGAHEAKTQFSRLLVRAKNGEEITITHRGRPVAKLVPAYARGEQEASLAAMSRLRARARLLKLGPMNWEEWKIYRDAGRR